MMNNNDSKKIMTLKERVLSDENIFNAIHALPSYIFEETLLNRKDLRLYHLLLDEFNSGLIKKTVHRCKKRISEILNTSACLFDVSVYFRIKKYESEKVEFRPMHTARLLDLICMASMLQCLMFEDNVKRKPSDLSKRIPDNFYGNRPSSSVDRIFEVWQEKYTAYNQKIVDSSKKYRQSHEYKTEVTLDIKNFFPSIPPRFIVDYCKETLSGRYVDKPEDLNTLTTILEKLIYLKVDESNIKDWEEVYYGKKILHSTLCLTRGVAQGLPQSYFFGNLCMVEIRNVLKKPEMFEGEAMYYVDDSVIYIKEMMSTVKLNERIKKLNDEVKAHINGFISSQTSVAPIKKFHDQISYEIEFHDSEKSHCCHIDDTGWNLHGLPRIVSGLDFSMLLDEIDQNIQIGKLEALDQYVKNYLNIIKITKLLKSKPFDESKRDELNDLIEKIKADNDFDLDIFKNSDNKVNAEDLEGDEKLLRRYRKLFLYNLKNLKFKQEGVITDKYFKEDFSIEINPTPEKIERWIDNDDGSRFRAEGRMLIRNLPNKKALELYKEACKWERYIASKSPLQSDWLYYRKDFKSTLELKRITDDTYNALKLAMKLHYSQLRQTNLENRINNLKDMISDLEIIAGKNEKEREERKDHPIYTIIHERMKYSLRNSEEMKRKILNAFFSFVSEYEISDSLTLVKGCGKPIPYSELRILAMLRNKDFSLKDFKYFIDTLDIYSLDNKMAIDYELTKILSEVRRYVSNPMWVDSVIQTHRITKGLWQNGSKFLNQYTLHNEEHAVTLIEKSIDIVKKINYFSLKQVDYFILFIACYLHDISMVIHPNLHDINNQSDKAHKLISKWILKLNEKKDKFKCDKIRETHHDHTNIFKETGLFLKDIFDDFYRHFEESIRDSHAEESARFVIEKQKDLFGYLDPAMASVIAHVGESHGYDFSDVYGLKSEALHDTISMKYIMMVIRLADLHDVANDRINYHLLKQNVWHMNDVSRFHWISHLITDSIRLVPEYKIFFDATLNEKKIDIQQHIIEILKFELYLNVKCLSPIPKNAKFSRCSGIANIELVPSQDNEADCFSVKIGSGTCSKGMCPTICRWTMKKHHWLVKELKALYDYLNSFDQGMIHTRIELNINFRDEFEIEQDLYDDVIKYLEEY